MVGAILKICEVASIPFKKTKASDELKYIPLLPEFLNCFKNLMYNSTKLDSCIFSLEVTE